MTTETGTWLGVDLGTSSVKVVAMRADAEVLAASTRGYPLSSPRAGWVEQNPQHWWSATAAAIREVHRATGHADIRGIGLSGQMHGLVPLTANGRVVRPAILWNDNRTEAQCAEIVDRVGGLDALVDLTNNASLAGFTAGKILWLREHEPESFAQTHIVLNPKDYLRFRLTGTFATDVSDASGTGLFDVRHRVWSTAMLRALDLDPELLPQVFESTEVTGRVQAASAAELEFSPGTPVVAGGGDSVLQTTSMGIISDGQMGVTIGTAGIVAQAAEDCPPNPEGRVQVSCGNEPGRWHVMGVALTAGEVLPWMGRALEPLSPGEVDVAKLVALAEQVEPGARGLRFAPHLVGERCPHPDPELRASWFGMDIRHNVADMVRAAVEGALLNLRQISDLFAELGLPSDSVRISGGASQYPLWTQTLTDILGRPIASVTGGVHGAAFGAAVLAAVGTGHWPNLTEALSHITAESETVPEPEAVRTYDSVYEEFLALHAAQLAFRSAVGKTATRKAR